MLCSTFKIEEFDSILSTNDMMRSLVRKQDVDPFTVIMAQEQIAGKGQRGRKWVSEKGKNLLCSLFYKPKHLKANEQFILTQLISVSIVEAIKKFIDHSNHKLSIKWPNDIYSGDRKLAGILIENAILGKYIQYSIIGVGLNINQEVFSDNLLNTVSLYQLSKKKHNIKSVLKEIIKNFEINRHLSHNVLKEKYAKYLFGLNELRSFIIRGEKRIASIKGVHDIGTLVLEFDKKQESFDHGSLDFIL